MKIQVILSGMSDEPTVKLEILENRLAVITLHRSLNANALNSQMALELKDIFAKIPDQIRAVIITGAGEKAFCAGADLKERLNLSSEQWQVQHQQFRHALQSIIECRVPVIAAVNGAAYGGGLEIALACDFIYASTNAYFALPEVTLGIMPGMGGTQNLPRALGIRQAKEFLFTGRPFSAQEAYDLGMINKICEQGSLINDALNCARTIAANAPLSVMAIKSATNRGINKPIEEALFNESSNYVRLLSTQDRKEGISAFNEKRKANFAGN